MIPARGCEGKAIGVFGMGRTGLATARALVAGGAQPVCWDDAEAGRAAAQEAGFQLADLSKPHIVGALDKLIVSPGLPHLFPQPHPAVAAALDAGVPLDNDIGLFLAEIAAQVAGAADKARDRAKILARARREVMASPRRVDAMTRVSALPPVLSADSEDLYATVRAITTPQVVCVTGSNGKSTTSALIAHLINSTGRPTQLGGNIGVGVFALEPARPGEVYVLEVSSYQTDLASNLHCDVACLTNLSPDHLDRHGGFGGYIAAKRRLLTESGARGRVVGVDSLEARALLAQLAGGAEGRWGLYAVGAQARRNLFDGVYYDGAQLELIRNGETLGDIDIGDADSLRGAHNAANAAVAAQVCLALGLTSAEIAGGFRSFEGLEHRMKTIAVRRGVRYVDDSKATNSDAAEKALQSFDKIRWIVGGQPKEGGLDPLHPHFGRVAKAYLIGEASEPFAAYFDQTDGAPAYEQCGDLATAVRKAADEATPGETVLLSPACASFDQFKDFAARGRAFQAATEALGA
ncbi:MAG: UDP-N-acetylmuramoyl-L-alanine--D-glutamate ligase [Neomegalonema sp.]|nr:UDP-N-acetylmuramoyl-L-alanine--D-glutamate ligase [Neomegalonema sp.]